MITIRNSEERGYANYGWLESHHTFSFGHYYDPEFTGFSDLRVINEDRVQPGQGFPTHSHGDMEIISYVLAGALEHKDSIGNSSVIRAGEVQRMSAGTGITHSEYNASDAENVHFLQIWIVPDRQGYSPGYEQKYFANEDMSGRLHLLVSPDGRDGSLSMHQDAYLYKAVLKPGDNLNYLFEDGRDGYIQLIRGTVSLNGRQLQPGDGAVLHKESSIDLSVTQDSHDQTEILLFDLRRQN